MTDYSISWGYIVSRMESLYGISPDNEEKVAFGDIERRIAYIWQEYFEMLYKEEFGENMGEPMTHKEAIHPLNNEARPTLGELAEMVVNDVLDWRDRNETD